MKIAVLIMGIVCLLLSILFSGYGIKYGLLKKEILTNHYTKTETGSKAVFTGIVYIITGILFFAGAILIFITLYQKIKHGVL